MSATAPPQSTPPTSTPRGNGRRFGPLIVTIGIVVGLILVFFWFTGFYADVLWFDHLGYSGVLFTRWIATAAMFLIGFVGMAVPTFLLLQFAYRNRPVYAKLSQQLGEYQKALEPIRRAVFFIIPAILGVLAGLSTAGSWENVLMFFNATPFGETDPIFGNDVSFYVFALPFWRGIVAFVGAVLLVGLVLSVAVSYLYGGIRITGREVVISKASRIQIAIVAGLFVLSQGVSFWFDRYNALTASNGRWTGALYSDDNASIPGLAIVAGAAVIVALLFFFAAVAGRWTLPVIGVAGLLVVGLVVGAVYPWVVQQLQVGPNEQQLETEYIQHNIDATRDAYDIADINVQPYAGVTTTESGQLREDAETTANIRILDPAIVGPTYAQFEQERAYYQFPEELDVDRYQIDGETQDAVMSVREINVDGLGADAQSWVNQTIVYTHGYGLVAGYGNQRGPDGQPLFFASGMPQDSALPEFEPRVYFGENSPEYSIVGAPEGGNPVEFDHIGAPASSGSEEAAEEEAPDATEPVETEENAGEGDASQTYTTFEGSGGPSLGNTFNRLVYAIKFQSEQILLSDAINEESQILYDRHPAERVEAAAPYLTLDSDVYASVVDGELVWIVDGYTTSDAYPYSTQTSITQASTDANTPAPSVHSPPINYIRNSVKATVNAYDGSVTLYAWDEEDPVLQTWQKIYPNTIEPVSEMSGDLLSHVRYPEDMFKVQRSILSTYHVTDAAEYYNQTNAWQLPLEPTLPRDQGLRQPPYYLTMQMPGQEPAFSLYSTFIPMVSDGANSRNVLTGYLSANANAGDVDGQVSEDYGTLTLLQIQNDSVNGPGQVQNIFNSNDEVANQLNLLERGGQTQVLRGNLLTLPVGEGFLYVQPVYVQSTGDTSYPLLRRVLVAFGDRIAFEDTLDAALDELFSGDSGASAGDGDMDEALNDPNVQVPDAEGAPEDVDTGEEAPPEEPAETEEPTETTAPPSDGGSSDAEAELAEALADASQALEDRTEAYANNDLVAAAEADARMTEALERAAEAEARMNNP
ncbi:UPF0182 family protein [Gulosibacter sp. 10]|uniref:UPF0182 family membrane protein n=1 Tax=Gulosibacter sp. 10 TaxID=1255570 RepID=UPI00097F1331|nr:UPF0182 family protein [Gulosibacter sp. 10]SJM56965.1 INTEGRAL MEMBRANE PROTEIN (Rhomboid family) [Gulosibacter sp. 10]